MVLATTAAEVRTRADGDEVDSSLTSPSSEGSERILKCAPEVTLRMGWLADEDGGAVRWCEGRSVAAPIRGRLLRSVSVAGAFRLDPGAGELEREAGGDGGSSGGGGAES